MILSRALQARPQNTPRSTERNSLNPPNLFSKPAAEQRTYQRPQIVHRHDSALQQAVGDHRRVERAVDSCSVSESHDVDVVLGIVDAAHHALVVAEEEDRETSDAIDGDEKLALLERVGDVPCLDLVAHCGVCVEEEDKNEKKEGKM